MAEPPGVLGAALLVRLWFEPDASGQGFRARITWTSDVRGTEESVVVTSPFQVLTKVESWLRDCQVHSPRPGPEK
ncbi:MAG: hypothetical protein ACRDSP_17940 [Pseudonocardiaceae bacterium]